jgi:hypothetical protein
MENKDVSQAGWTLEDFGIDRDDYLKSNNPSEGFSPNYTSGVSGGFQQNPKEPVTKNLPMGQEVTSRDDYLPDTLSIAKPIEMGLINPQEQSELQGYLEDQTVFEQAAERTKTFLSSLFDTEDEKETVVESAWDGFLTGINWTYDRINQVTSAGLSGLPGGIETLSWDEAADVSVGQVVVANAALSAQDIEEGDVAKGLFGLATAGPIGLFGTQISEDVIGSDFDITNEAERNRAFTEDPLGKWTSGLTDAVFTVAADPLIVGGKALKVARIKWVDKPIVSQKQRDELAATLADDASKLASGQEQNLSSYGRFLNWVGEEGRTIDEIYNHPTIKEATNRDELTSLLANADNFNERSLIMRVAYGDARARQELINTRVELADQWGYAQRERLSFVLANKPEVTNKVNAFYSRKTNQYQRELDQLTEAGAPQEAIDAAKRKRDQYLQLTMDLREGRLVRDPIIDGDSKEALALARETMNALVRRDNYLAKAIDTEASIAGANKTFAADNIVGRAVESRRQRIAQRSAEMEGATFKSLWASSDYSPLGKAGRTIRLWRWFGKEKPAGYIFTKGPNTQEQFREIRANLNGLDIYRGDKSITLADGQVVRLGKQRREQLIERYMNAVGSSVEDQNKMAFAINGLEKQIMSDLAAWHGLDAKAAQTLTGQAVAKRKQLIESIRNRGFWVEDGKMQRAPYLESQLQNGTYLMNYRAIDRELAAMAKTGQMASLNNAARYGGEKLANFYDAFNNVWRPSVLLRLGYAQRNYAEGIFRSSAYLGSLAPLAYSGKQAAFGFRNYRTRKVVEAEVKRVEPLLQGKLTREQAVARIAGSKFDDWRETQLTVLRERIAKEEEWIAETKTLRDGMDRANAEFATVDQNISRIERQLADTRSDVDALENPVTALSLYKAQGAQKRRVFDGEYERADPYLAYKAFGNPRFADMAWSNMSADATTRATLSLRMQTSQSIFRNYVERYYVSVNPTDGDRYYQGVAEMLKQFRASEVGRQIIDDVPVEKIAAWLRTSDEGKEIVRFLNNAIGPKRGTQGAIRDARIRDFDDALDYVIKTKERLMEIAPSPELRAAIKSDQVVLRQGFWEDVKRYLDTDEYRGGLVPAVGNLAEETATKTLRQSVDTLVQNAFRWLGTLPEDAFVRAPFYGRRYEDVRGELMAQLDQQFTGKTVPFSEIARRERIAHRRALKDTKDWLYTIERRTNLGHYGEFLVPFISATQNSVTALGRLTWRDPSLIGVVSLLWQAPARAGMEDEDGNIVIPLPEGIIPDGIAEAVGLDNMRNIRINKGSLNVVFPETGYGFIPRPGPLFAVPASEIMKRGMFGASVETPTVLREMFGEDAANELWGQWRKYIFGEERGLSAESLSWNMWTPPAAAKIVQMLQGEGGSTSYAYMYNLQYRTELAKALAGERDMPESMEEFKAEIKSRTNGMFMLRALANLTAFTPPQYESKLEPLIDTIRQYEQKDPLNGLRKFNEDYGNMLLMIGDFKVSQNVAGVRADVTAVENARKYSDIIGNVAPEIQDNLSTLGIILNNTSEGLYDGSAYAWQRATRIPGLNKTYREVQTPEQAMVESSKNAGWTQFVSFMDSLDAILQQRGLESYRSSAASDLREMKREFIAKMSSNPLYQGWYQDYIDFGSTRTVAAVKVMQEALSNEKFVEDHAGDPIWESAVQYLELRRDVIYLTKESGSTINAEANKDIRDLWDRGRQRLINQSTKWASIANRYLNGDDDPTDPGANLSETLAMSGGAE